MVAIMYRIYYTFDNVGNVEKYTNDAWGHTTSQNYGYDGLYQLTSVKGESRSHPWSPTGSTEYTTDYEQIFKFNHIGNMTSKLSKENVSNTNRIGTDLNYSLDYNYYPGTHKAERIGSRYYDYDGNGNLIAEREGGHAVDANVYRPYHQDGNLYWTDYGFGLVKPENKADDGIYQRNYKWNERNLLSESSDMSYTVQYRYGADGQRALKFTANSGRSTVYFNKMWQTSDISADWLQSKHIYVGEDRIATKYNSEGNENTQAEKERTYYYHSDHLGSAQTVTNHKGQVHERLEYTPYGELWIDWKNSESPGDPTPFRFTGKEPDPETGLYYYGARYLDPKTSRWLSGDPALGEYLPVAPLGDDEKKRNSNLPGQGGIFNTVNMHLYHYAGNNPVKYVDPDGEKNYIIIAMFPGGGNENVGATFEDAANTRKNEIESNPSFDNEVDTVTMKTVDSINELVGIINEGNIDQLDIFSHGGDSWLVVGSGQGPNKREHLRSADLKKFNKNSFNAGASINLFGCKTASKSDTNLIKKLIGPTMIADSIALYFKGVTVTGFTGGSMAVPSPEAKTNINFVHQKGDPVWYKSASGTRSYKY